MVHENGLIISYSRVLEISSQLGEDLVAQYIADIACLPILRTQVFTTAAPDNICHNPTATTAETPFQLGEGFSSQFCSAQAFLRVFFFMN